MSNFAGRQAAQPSALGFKPKLLQHPKLKSPRGIMTSNLLQDIAAAHASAWRLCCSSTQSCAPSNRSLTVAVVVCRHIQASKQASAVHCLHGWASAQGYQAELHSSAQETSTKIRMSVEKWQIGLGLVMDSWASRQVQFALVTLQVCLVSWHLGLPFIVAALEHSHRFIF